MQQGRARWPTDAQHEQQPTGGQGHVDQGTHRAIGCGFLLDGFEAIQQLVNFVELGGVAGPEIASIGGGRNLLQGGFIEVRRWVDGAVAEDAEQTRHAQRL